MIYVGGSVQCTVSLCQSGKYVFFVLLKLNSIQTENSTATKRAGGVCCLRDHREHNIQSMILKVYHIPEPGTQHNYTFYVTKLSTSNVGWFVHCFRKLCCIVNTRPCWNEWGGFVFCRLWSSTNVSLKTAGMATLVPKRMRYHIYSV